MDRPYHFTFKTQFGTRRIATLEDFAGSFYTFAYNADALLDAVTYHAKTSNSDGTSVYHSTAIS